jgi:hypothetical protein
VARAWSVSLLNQFINPLLNRSPGRSLETRWIHCAQGSALNADADRLTKQRFPRRGVAKALTQI